MTRTIRLAAGAALLLLGGCVVATVPAQPVSSTGVPLGATCYAGVYVCPAPGGAPVGTSCACPGLGAPSYGSVH